jgi:hypothetical protein
MTTCSFLYACQIEVAPLGLHDVSEAEQELYPDTLKTDNCKNNQRNMESCSTQPRTASNHSCPCEHCSEADSCISTWQGSNQEPSDQGDSQVLNWQHKLSLTDSKEEQKCRQTQYASLLATALFHQTGPSKVQIEEAAGRKHANESLAVSSSVQLISRCISNV